LGQSYVRWPVSARGVREGELIFCWKDSEGRARLVTSQYAAGVTRRRRGSKIGLSIGTEISMINTLPEKVSELCLPRKSFPKNQERGDRSPRLDFLPTFSSKEK